MSKTIVVSRASRYGRFRPYRLRASGGFSDVYLARDNTGKTAALKVYRSLSNDDSNSMERFRREKSILERVGSRRVARLLEADLDATPPWIASEFINGPTLREAVDQAGPLGLNLAAGVLSLLAETLAELHDLGVAHRDLNPNNIILSKDGPTLIDFGSAQLLATGQANFSRLSIGTPGYISPEQLDGKPATLASDVYSFGKLASFLITGDSTEQSRQRFSNFVKEQEDILWKCLSDDPLDRPNARELQTAFASIADPVAAIQKLDYKSPELRKLPRGRVSTILTVFVVGVLIIGAVGVWRTTSKSELVSGDLVTRLSDDHQKYGDLITEVVVRSGDYGVIEAMSLPLKVDVSRDRRNFSVYDRGFLDYFKLEQEEVIDSTLVVYALPSVTPPTFRDLVGVETAPRLLELEGFGTDIADRISQFQSEFVYADCALDVPETVSVDIKLSRIRHVSSAPVCFDLLNSTKVFYAIHDWYPDKNLLFELTGWVDIAILDPIPMLDSIQLSEGLTNPVARPIAPLTLSDLSIHEDNPSLINENEEGAFFYANVFVEIPPLASISLNVTVPDDSPAHFSFTVFRDASFRKVSQESANQMPETYVPAGRLWAVSKHQLRFDNPDTKSVVLSFEIDSSDTAPPNILISTTTIEIKKDWVTAPTLSFGIGIQSPPIESKLRFMLHSLGESDQSKEMSFVGSLEIPIPIGLQPTTNDELAVAGFREFWPTSTTTLRELDLPHLQMTTEQFSRQIDGSNGTVWVRDPAFLACRTPITFTYSGTRTVEWSVFSNCSIPDAMQASFFAQAQASLIFKFVVYDGIKSESDDIAIAYRGKFVPGSHQHLDYFKFLLTYLAQ